MKISIVMSYFNRKKQLTNTLKTIKRSSLRNDLEVIIVDDASDDDHRLDNIKEYPDLDIKIIRVDQKDKWYMNPCIPFNMGFKKAIGEIVIIQNPECFHFGDVSKYIYDNLKKDQYFSMACYSVNKQTSDKLNEIFDGIEEDTFKNLSQFLKTFPDIPVRSEGVLGWYNHPIHRATGYHFTSAMHRENLEELRGFDERFANGLAWDDNEFRERIKRYGLKIEIPTDPFSVHQWHYSVVPPDRHAKEKINENIWVNKTLKEDGWKVNV